MDSNKGEPNGTIRTRSKKGEKASDLVLMRTVSFAGETFPPRRNIF
jgi:hypothetical protein